MTDFGVKESEVLGDGPLLYGDFMVPNADNKIYEEIMDQQKVHAHCGTREYATGLRKVRPHLYTTVHAAPLLPCT